MMMIDYDETATFCSVQKINSGEYMFILYSKESTPEPVEKSDNDFSEMSFYIERQMMTHDKLAANGYATPYDILKTLPSRVITATKEEAKLAMFNIAREIGIKSKSFRGNTILCHPDKMEYVKSLEPDQSMSIMPYCKLDENEYFILFNNKQAKREINGAIYQVHIDDHDPRFIPNPRIENYAIRFQLNEISEA